MRRAGVAFAALFFLSVFGVGSIVSMLAGGRRVGFAIWPLVWPFLFFLFVVVIRRFALPMGDVVEAADRVASGDFAARVPEQGPRSLRAVAHAFNSMTARLEMQDRQRRHLLADIAHELRTPLSVIQGRLEGVLDGVYPRDEAQIRQVLGDARTLSRLVDDLRTLAHAESGTLALDKEPTDLGVLAHDVIDTFSAEAAAGGVSLQLEATAEPPLVLVDPLRIREVLINLMSNALRHTPAGGSVTIAIRAESNRVVVQVADTGKGMTPEEASKVFERFYKGPQSRGSGLGLTIARNLVIAHHGEIHCDSRPGTGTTFTFTLPLTR
jgi:two-component system OmpR family sensor kinase/two-component system sensor histidine kinase BaeS